MYRVYIFTLYVGPSVEFEDGLHVGLAITQDAKWVAGSCSQSAENALVYVERMKKQIAERVGKPIDNVELVRQWVPELVAKVFEKLP